MTFQQKKVLAIALTVLSSFALVYVLKRSIEKINQHHIQDNKKSWSQFAIALNKQQIDHLAKINSEFGLLLKNPIQLAQFLNQFSKGLSYEQRFELALRCEKKLTRLDLGGFEDLDDKMLEELTKACPFLESLNLENTFIETLSLPTSLKALDLSNCDRLPKEELEKLAFLQNLEKLSLQVMPIQNLKHLSKTLKELDLGYCKQLTDQDCECLASFPNLEKLNLSTTSICKLPGLPACLKELNLSSCSNISSEELEMVNTQIEKLDNLPPKLKRLSLFLCSNIPSDEFKNLAVLSDLEELNVCRTKIQRLDHLPLWTKRRFKN